MAEDELIDDEPFDESLEADLEEEEPDLEEELDDEDLAEDDLVVEPDLAADVAVVVEPEPEVAAKPRKKRDDEDEEEEEVDPDDVEADLDAILKDRIAATDDEEDDEDLEVEAPRASGELADGVQPKKANEFMCTGCFLLVNAGQFGPPTAMECPVGEAVCPAIDQLRKQHARARRQAG